MIWPWKRPVAEHRASSFTDQVVTALVASASGGGVRPALATSALEAAAALYASALASCSISGPSSVVRALTADWRAAAASSLIRSGQAVYIIGADPVDGLTLAPVGHWNVNGGPRPASWFYRCELSGPSGAAWETHPAAGVLHLRWQVDPARPWAGISPLGRASDTGSLAGWLERRLSEEVSSPVGSFLPVARYDASGADLDADADADPLAMLRADIGNAKGQTLLVESQMAAADSPASAPRKDYQVARFGADPPDSLIALRDKVAADIGAACAIPRGLLVSSGSAQSARESWRQFVSTGVAGLCRRIEAQVLAQLGVEVAIDTEPLAGRDLAGRAGAFSRLIKGEGMTVAAARQAAGI